MNLTLRNNDFRPDGIFGILIDDNNNEICKTLQHSYQQPDKSYAAKVPPGTYRCVRGQHQLAHMTSPFTTFEITGVTGHTNILFHVGNYNNDSEGCVLLGMSIAPSLTMNCEMLLNSKKAFEIFMDLQKSVNEFELTVL